MGKGLCRRPFADRLGFPLSNDTLLRTVRRYDRPPPPPSVIGIDDWAWRRNHRYGTIICDLEPVYLPEAWQALQQRAAIALGFPLGIFITGFAFVWACSGFARPKAP